MSDKMWQKDPVTNRPYRLVQDLHGRRYVQWDSDHGPILPTGAGKGDESPHSNQRRRRNKTLLPNQASVQQAANSEAVQALPARLRELAAASSLPRQSPPDTAGPGEGEAVEVSAFKDQQSVEYEEGITFDRDGSQSSPSEYDEYSDGVKIVAENPQPSEIPYVAKTAIRSTAGDVETLDWRYRKVSNAKRFFAVGRVFAILWHEPMGSNGTHLSQRGHFTVGEFGEAIYSSIRRMVVVNEGPGYCWCLPIITYSGRGTAKAGLSPIAIRQHTIIYMANTQPARLADEKGMTKRPLAVDPADPRQKLDPLSRLNFGKIYTVEHAVKVTNIGTISRRSLPHFMAYWQNTIREN